MEDTIAWWLKGVFWFHVYALIPCVLIVLFPRVIAIVALVIISVIVLAILLVALLCYMDSRSSKSFRKKVEWLIQQNEHVETLDKLLFYEACSVLSLDGERLTVIYDYSYRGLHMLFHSDKKMKAYIQDNTTEAVRCGIIKASDRYVLNVAPCCGYTVCEWKKGGSYDLLEKQLDVYMPIIDYFLLHGFKDVLK